MSTSKSPDQPEKDFPFLTALWRDDGPGIQRMISKAAPAQRPGLALQWAACRGAVEELEILVRQDVGIQATTDALMWAIKKNQGESFRFLMPLADLRVGGSHVLVVAARHGRTDMVAQLIPLCDPMGQESGALMWAALGGFTDVVRLLIPVSDPRASHSKALYSAINKGQMAAAQELMPVSDVVPVWHQFASDENWGALDVLAEVVPLELLRPVVANATPPAPALPRVRARLTAHDLAQAFAAAVPEPSARETRLRL